MTKINEKTMREQYDRQYKTFCKKNSDYGNSFEESLDKHGIVASIVRMSDKMNRLEALTDESRTQQVGSESLLDTLEDLSNYAALTACWLKGVRAEDGEEEVGSVYVFGQDEPYLTFKKPKKHLHNDDDQIDMMRYANEFIPQNKEIDELSKNMEGVIGFLVSNLKIQRNPKSDLNVRIHCAKLRANYYKEIANIILSSKHLSFDIFSRYFKTRSDLTQDEKQMVLEGVMQELYSQTDKNPGGDEESEFLTKQFNFPKEDNNDSDC
nr:MAG TPA: Nucleotide modification associated domain 1 [Caudoviricetes sp.]